MVQNTATRPSIPGVTGSVGQQGDTGPAIATQLVIVDQTLDAEYVFASVDIHNAGSLVQLTDGTVDAGWTRAANVVTFTGSPAKVQGFISLNAFDSGASNYWARPKLRVIKSGAVIAVLDDLVMQQNGSYDGDATINGVFFDKNPGTDPKYTFEWFDKDGRTSTLPPQAYSRLTLTATNKVSVYSPL